MRSFGIALLWVVLLSVVVVGVFSFTTDGTGERTTGGYVPFGYCHSADFEVFLKEECGFRLEDMQRDLTGSYPTSNGTIVVTLVRESAVGAQVLVTWNDFDVKGGLPFWQESLEGLLETEFSKLGYAGAVDLGRAVVYQ